MPEAQPGSPTAPARNRGSRLGRGTHCRQPGWEGDMGHHAGDIDNGARHPRLIMPRGHASEAKIGRPEPSALPHLGHARSEPQPPLPHLGHLEHSPQVHTEGPGETADSQTTVTPEPRPGQLSPSDFLPSSSPVKVLLGDLQEGPHQCHGCIVHQQVHGAHIAQSLLRGPQSPRSTHTGSIPGTLGRHWPVTKGVVLVGS